MEPKKISFGFSKINKKLNLVTPKENLKNEPTVELIKCLEGQEIKLVQEKPAERPLVIPLKESQKTSAALASLIKRRAVLLGEEEAEQTNPQDVQKAAEDCNPSTNNEPEDIEKRAARELLAELQTNGSSDPSSNLVLPVVNPDELPLEGAKESSLDDYDSIPIQDFGKAMLRGMGWSEPVKTATKGGPPIDDTPMVRPKGMGLGADKALKSKPLLVAPENNEVLEVKRNAYVRILGGKHKDLYGQIEGFDDHAGRVIVKMAIGGAKETFNEFLCQPVARKEFAHYGKCINSTKYDEYKKKENEFGQIILKKEEIDELEGNSKQEKIRRKEGRESNDDYKYHHKRNDRDRKFDEYKDEKKEFKKEKDSNRERSRDDGIEFKRDEYKNEEKAFKKEKYEGDSHRERSREELKKENREVDRVREKDKNRGEKQDHGRDDRRDRERDDSRDDRRDRGRDDKSRRDTDRYDEKDRQKNNDRDNGRDRQRERNHYDSKYEDRNQQTQSYKDNRDKQRDRDRESYRYKHDDRDSNRHSRDRDHYNKDNPDRDHKNNDQRSRNKDRSAERTTKRSDKIIQLDDSSDSESDSHSKRHKKSTKKDKKSSKKKSKKSKSKYKKDKSDSETSSSSSSSSDDSSSDSEEEKRKKHKKKTKKSKKQRERSRSRGRR